MDESATANIVQSVPVSTETAQHGTQEKMSMNQIEAKMCEITIFTSLQAWLNNQLVMYECYKMEWVGFYHILLPFALPNSAQKNRLPKFFKVRRQWGNMNEVKVFTVNQSYHLTIDVSLDILICRTIPVICLLSSFDLCLKFEVVF